MIQTFIETDRTDMQINELMAKEFRQAMSRLSAAVNVVSTDGPNGRYGVTASAVCSVTDAPPTVLVCLNRKGAAHDALLGNGKVCINILSGRHENLAMQFAGMTNVPHAQRFSSEMWHEGSFGLPVLRDALASLEGVIVYTKIVGSHTVIFVEIANIQMGDSGDSLTYFGRAFHRLREAVPA
ncbi:4-hydroxyphenylacetate 3-monooxygenase reductase subunit [Pandoraea captiosa]|uniref:4-hydroxyphenylacetate 3-monooxygenase reductase subunit n=2 Tax=Pandoraea captiosa TaxID=2508302 RepID=A0A5E5AH14_9BURK|nr:4-hydroxyphenylacetate 3-monooxygenase reductase subunit [Pandoraea captiosa]